MSGPSWNDEAARVAEYMKAASERTEGMSEDEAWLYIARHVLARVKPLSATNSGFSKTGGYASPLTPVASLPKVPSGPAPGVKQ